MILKLGMDDRELKGYKAYVNNDPGLTFFGKFKFGQNCLLCLYQAQMSGECLQDHWSCIG